MNMLPSINKIPNCRGRRTGHFLYTLNNEEFENFRKLDNTIGQVEFIKNILLTIPSKCVSPIPKDGNCLFHSLAKTMGPTYDDKRMRREIINYMKDNQSFFDFIADPWAQVEEQTQADQLEREAFRNFLRKRLKGFTEKGKSWDNLHNKTKYELYLEYMSEDASFGTQVEIIAFASFFKTNVCVLETDRGKTKIRNFLTPPPPPPHRFRDIIFLYYQDGNHYDLLDIGDSNSHRQLQNKNRSKFTNKKSPKLAQKKGKIKDVKNRNKFNKGDTVLYIKEKKNAKIEHVDYTDPDEIFYTISIGEREINTLENNLRALESKSQTKKKKSGNIKSNDNKKLKDIKSNVNKKLKDIKSNVNKKPKDIKSNVNVKPKERKSNVNVKPKERKSNVNKKKVGESNLKTFESIYDAVLLYFIKKQKVDEKKFSLYKTNLLNPKSEKSVKFHEKIQRISKCLQEGKKEATDKNIENCEKALNKN